MAFQGFAREDRLSNKHIRINIQDIINKDLAKHKGESAQQRRNQGLANKYGQMHADQLESNYNLQAENLKVAQDFLRKNKEAIFKQEQKNFETAIKNAGVPEPAPLMEAIIPALIQGGTQIAAAGIKKHMADKRAEQAELDKETVQIGVSVADETGLTPGEAVEVKEHFKDQTDAHNKAQLTNSQREQFRAERLQSWNDRGGSQFSSYEQVEQIQAAYKIDSTAIQMQQGLNAGRNFKRGPLLNFLKQEFENTGLTGNQIVAGSGTSNQMKQLVLAIQRKGMEQFEDPNGASTINPIARGEAFKQIRSETDRLTKSYRNNTELLAARQVENTNTIVAENLLNQGRYTEAHETYFEQMAVQATNQGTDGTPNYRKIGDSFLKILEGSSIEAMEGALLNITGVNGTPWREHTGGSIGARLRAMLMQKKEGAFRHADVERKGVKNQIAVGIEEIDRQYASLSGQGVNRQVILEGIKSSIEKSEAPADVRRELMARAVELTDSASSGRTAPPKTPVLTHMNRDVPAYIKALMLKKNKEVNPGDVDTSANDLFSSMSGRAAYDIVNDLLRKEALAFPDQNDVIGFNNHMQEYLRNNQTIQDILEPPPHKTDDGQIIPHYNREWNGSIQYMDARKQTTKAGLRYEALTHKMIAEKGYRFWLKNMDENIYGAKSWLDAYQEAVDKDHPTDHFFHWDNVPESIKAAALISPELTVTGVAKDLMEYYNTKYTTDYTPPADTITAENMHGQNTALTRRLNNYNTEINKLRMVKGHTPTAAAVGTSYISGIDRDRQDTGRDVVFNNPEIRVPKNYKFTWKSKGTDGRPSVGIDGTVDPGLGPNGRGFGQYGAYFYISPRDGKEYEVLLGHGKGTSYRGRGEGEHIPTGTLLQTMGNTGRSVSGDHTSIHINGVGFTASDAELMSLIEDLGGIN